MSKIIGATKFSVYAPDSTAWKASNGSRFRTVEEYKEYLFNDERLSLRADIFLNISLPQIAIAAESCEYSHIVSYSTLLPKKVISQLEQAANRYSFLILDPVDVNDEPITAESVLHDQGFVGVCGVLRIDDDDLISADFLRNASSYVSAEFVGMRVSQALGYTGIWNRGRIHELRYVHKPMIAIGLLAVIQRFADGTFKGPPRAPHIKSDRHGPVILDSRSPGFIWLRHPTQDTELNRRDTSDQMGRLIEELNKYVERPGESEVLDSFPKLAKRMGGDLSPIVSVKDIVLDPELTLDINDSSSKLRIRAAFELSGEPSPSNILVSILLVDRNGVEFHSDLSALGYRLSPNRRIGNFKMVRTRNGLVHFNEVLNIPEGLRLSRVTFIKYKKLDTPIRIVSAAVYPDVELS